MRPLSFFKKRKVELRNKIIIASQDLQGAEHDLKANPCKETWEAVESLGKKLALLDSELDGVEWTLTHYQEYCYYEEQEELMTAMYQECYVY